MHPRFFERWQQAQRDTRPLPRSDEVSGLSDRELVECMLQIEARLVGNPSRPRSGSHLRLVDEELAVLHQRHQQLLAETARRRDRSHDQG